MILLTFDPGGTTGFACFDTAAHRDLKIGDFPYFDDLDALLDQVKPDIIVIEAFRLYPWKAKHKTWSSFPEIEVIGAIKHACRLRNIPFEEQGADTKVLFDDVKLKKLNYWDNISRHARDAVRHALYYMTVGGDYHWVKQL